MPSLPDVTQRFEADVAPYIAAIRAAAQATKDLSDAVNAATADIKLMQAAMNGMSGTATGTAIALQGTAGASNDLRDVLLVLRAILQELRDQSLMLGAALTFLDDKLADVVKNSAAANIALGVLGDQMTKLAAKSVAAGAVGGRGAAAFLFGWRLTGNAIHWIISGTIELLAVVLPAAIAAAAGALVLYQGVVEQVTRRMNALFTAAEATGNMLHKTAGDALIGAHAFQAAQDAANPIAYQLLGNMLIITQAHMVNLASAGLTVARAVGELGARIQVDLLSHGNALAGLLSHMVPDLIQIGQVFGNIGHAILNLAADMPGLAEALLRIVDGISHVILWISQLPRWLILAVAAFEEFNRWGGLAVSVLGRMGFAWVALEGRFFSFARAASVVRAAMTILPMIIARIGAAIVGLAPEMGIFAGSLYTAGASVEEFGLVTSGAIAGLSVGWTLGIGVAAVALGFLIDKLATARSSAQMFGDALEKNIAKASNVQALGVITNSVGQLNEKLAQAPHITDAAANAMGRYGGAVQRFVNQSGQQLSQVQQKIIGQSESLISGADKISRAYGTSFSGSLALADIAGVKLANTEVTLGHNANVAGAQIEGLVQGYQKLNQTGGILNNDMNVLAIQSGLAGTKVGQLNQAWDQFLQNATGITSSLATLNQDLTQIGNVGVSAARAFRVFSGTAKISVDAVAQSLTSFSGKSAQTWQNYDAALNAAQQFTDNLRIASAYGAVSQRNYTGSIANTVGALLPFAAKSRTAVEELSALAQEAGGPATGNFKTLKDWVDKNHISADAFNKAIQTMTGQLGNAGAAAREFASTLQSQMQQDLANALLSQSNLNAAVGKFQQAVLASGGQINASSPAFKALYNDLRAAGLSAAQARAEMRFLQNTIDGLHGKTITVGVTTVYQQVGQPSRPGQTGVGAVGGQHGGIVGGAPGIDRTPMMLSAGEAILTARAVAALGGPLAIHGLNNTPSQAVLATGGGSGGAGALSLSLNVPVELNGSRIATAHRTETLIYSRRNPSNNLNLRVR